MLPLSCKPTAPVTTRGRCSARASMMVPGRPALVGHDIGGNHQLFHVADKAIDVSMGTSLATLGQFVEKVAIVTGYDKRLPIGPLFFQWLRPRPAPCRPRRRRWSEAP